MVLLLGLAISTFPARGTTNFDVVVYGGTPAGIMAAVAAASHGQSVVLFDLNNHEGGMVSGGLTYTDMGARATVGGLANVFFNRILSYYETTYGANSPQVVACQGGQKFEAHVAEMIFDQMLKEHYVTVIPNVCLNLKLPNAVTTAANGNITSVTVQDVLNGTTKTFTGKMFIDASYEGDLMAGSHTTYTFGREAQSEYGESLAGIRVPGPNFGQADDLIMSYNYRPTLTNRPGNTIPFPKPAHYDPTPFLAEYGTSLTNGSLTQFVNAFFSGPPASIPTDACPNSEYCTNSFDFPGSSDGYADGDWTTRDEVAQTLGEFEESCFYFLQHDTASLSPAFYKDAQKWGFPKNEFTDTGGFPFQLYVREARRMVGNFVLRQADITQSRYKVDGVCSASWGIDCHIINVATVNGKSYIDTTPSLGVPIYDIPYACLTPSRTGGQPGNLLVPVCCSASHVAYDSLRLEPVYMMLGQAAGDAAHLAIANAIPVQQVNVVQLRALLQADGAVLNSGYLPSFRIAFTPAHPAIGQAVTFTVGAAVPPLAPFTHYWWDFKGTGAVAAQLPSSTFVFNQNKTYTVSLIIQDSVGRRGMATCQVPVGTAAGQDLTVDDFDPSVTYSGSWTAGFPVINRNPNLVEVFTGPSTHYSTAGKTKPAQAIYQPSHLPAGLYQVCLGYRPDQTQATAALLTINCAGGTFQTMVNEQTVGTSPFPFVSLGTFRFSGNGSETVSISTTTLPTLKVATDAVRWVWVGN